MFLISFIFFVVCSVTRASNSYNCSNGVESDYRILVISPQEHFMFNRFLDNSTSHAPISSGIKILPQLTTTSGFIQGSQKCLTVIETPQVFSYLDVIDTVDQISERCFAKIYIMAEMTTNNGSLLTPRETEMLVSTLKLLESIYVNNIWDSTEVILWESQGHANSNYRKWLFDNIQIPVLGKGAKNLNIQTLNSNKKKFFMQSLINFNVDESFDFEQKQESFITKSGIPWIGNPADVYVNSNKFNVTIDIFVLSDTFDMMKFSVIHNGREADLPINVINRRNDLFQVKVKISNKVGRFSFKYDNHFSINTVNINLDPRKVIWSVWSEWNKCSQIDERTSRSRHQLSDLNARESESRTCYCSDLKDYPKPRVLMIGKTGVGKSSLGNQLLGGYKAFALGHGTESKTEEISVFTGNFLGVGHCFTIIDTPGAKDTKGRDYKHTLAMQRLLKKDVKSFEAILLLTSGGDPRVDSGTIELLRWYEAVFGAEMWKHVIIEVTFWSHKRSAVQQRWKRRRTNEQTFADGLREKIGAEMNISSEIYIPVTFVDPMFGIFEDPCQDQSGSLEPEEKRSFLTQIKQLHDYIQNLPPYDCKERCMAPDVFFSGAPFVSIPIDKTLNMKRGDKKLIEWQIWTGVTSNHTVAYDVLVNDGVAFKKSDGELNQDVSFPDLSEFRGFSFSAEESSKVPKVTSLKLSIELDKDTEPSLLNFTSELKNEIEADALVEILVAKDAKLTKWSDWSTCSISCINEGDKRQGTQHRTRDCIPEENEGQSCADLLNQPDIPAYGWGSENETVSCSGGDAGTIVHCPVDLKWSGWTEWGDCSAQCGPGKRKRSRSCTNGRHGGSTCKMLHEFIEEECVIKKECPRNCKLSEWTVWSSCSASCNVYTSTNFSTRQRSKSILVKSNEEGARCSDMVTKETELCHVHFCPVDGVWSDWSSFTRCSLTCGEGSQIAYRFCNGPSNGGKNCVGETHMYKKCKLADCPVDCTYTAWSAWAQCNKTCGPGSHTRRRTKTEPKFGGKSCSEPIEESSTCFQSQCPASSKGGGGLTYFELDIPGIFGFAFGG